MFFEYFICEGKAYTHYTPNYKKKKKLLLNCVWPL